MKIIIDELKLRASGWAISLGCAVVWGAIAFTVIAFFDPQFSRSGSAVERIFAPLVGGGGLAMVCFLLFHSPLRGLTSWLLTKVPILGWVVLPFVIGYYLLAWPGIFLAERLGLVERIA
mgnify:CR=1 FL=1